MTENDKGQQTEPSETEQETKKGWQNSGLMNYSSSEKQSVFQLFGIEMTAPAGLKNPGLIYLAFIFINLILFLLLRNFVTN